ncbi:MAG: hypothetical protein H0V82_05100 [Candidatus Protochlamydia sp.]|nr:hypothetical protein [Candidatus Protochlamydia sp.]
MFLIQFMINLFGMSDQETGHSVESSNDTADVRKFKMFSMQAITGFLMMFGWTAITCQSEFGLPIFQTVVISVASGLFTALIIHSIYKLAKKLQSPGCTYRIEDAIGKEAYVYQSIPKGGAGKISIALNNFTHEINAESDECEELTSFTRVKIIKVKDNQTLIVTPCPRI